jgi:hypothetical protein
VYQSGIAVAIIVAASFAGLGLLAAHGLLRHVGIFMLELSAAWVVGLLFADHWLAFSLLAAMAVSHHVTWSIWHRGDRSTSREIDGEPLGASSDSRDASHSTVEVVTQPEEYHRAVDRLERDAREVEKVLRRLNTVFKTEEYAQVVAKARYGENSPLYTAYVETHRVRRRAFQDKLQSGKLVHREICSLNVVRNILLTPDHPGVNWLPQSLAEAQVQEVIQTLRLYPHGYSLGLSAIDHPFRYAVYDQRTVVIHEAVGSADVYRVNSIFMHGGTAVKAFRDEFNMLWEQMPLDCRENGAVADRLEALLTEALSARGSSAQSPD